MSEVVDVLKRARTIAVLGANTGEHRPAFYVPAYLRSQGYRILPVNPRLVRETLFGEPVRETLAELKAPVDFVDVFRRAEHLMAHLDDVLAMQPRPPLVWLQLGIRSDAFADALEAERIEVIQDRCTLADHKRFNVGPVG